MLEPSFVYLHQDRLERAWGVVGLAGIVGLVVLEDNHKEEMDLEVGIPDQVEDTSQEEVRHMAFPGMEDQEDREDQEDHLGPNQQVVVGRIEVDTEGGVHMEDHSVPDLEMLEADLVGGLAEDLALVVCDVVALVLEPALVLGVEGVIRSRSFD